MIKGHGCSPANESEEIAHCWIVLVDLSISYVSHLGSPLLHHFCSCTGCKTHVLFIPQELARTEDQKRSAIQVPQSTELSAEGAMRKVVFAKKLIYSSPSSRFMMVNSN